MGACTHAVDVDTKLDLDDIAVGEGGERLVVGEGRDVRDGVVDRDGGREGDALGDLETLLVVDGGNELVDELVAGRAKLEERLAGLNLGDELLENLANDGRGSLVLGDADGGDEVGGTRMWPGRRDDRGSSERSDDQESARKSDVRSGRASRRPPSEGERKGAT